MSPEVRAGRDCSRKEEATDGALGGQAWPPALSQALSMSLQGALPFLFFCHSLFITPLHWTECGI